MNKVFQTNDCPYDLRNPRILTSKHKSTRKYLAKHYLRNMKFGIS